jgi:membrane fusion protein, adhesin transport system
MEMTQTCSAGKPTGKILFLTSALVVVSLAVWSFWAKIDIIARASGSVVASSRNQVIQAADGGTITDIMVKEGDAVRRGQRLVVFEQVKTEASYRESLAKEASLKAAIARLNAEIAGTEPKFPREVSAYPELIQNHRTLFRKRQAAVNDDIAMLDKSRQLAKDELAMNLPLLKTGDVSKADILRLQRQVVEIEGKISSVRDKYLQDAQSELSKAQEELESVQQVLIQRKDQYSNTVIESPVDGIVRNVRITTRGGVAKPGEEIMQIVPSDDKLLIEVKVQPADIAFVKPGLPATIKMDAYDYTIYGSLSGVVTYVSADSINEEGRNPNEKPYFKVLVKATGRNYLGSRAENIKIQPGMTGTVEIKTGSKSVWQYLTKPLSKTLSDSLGER